MAIAIGSVAPDFTLKTLEDRTLSEVTLSKHRGKENVVLLFIPGAFTHVCTAEFCDVTNSLEQYSKLNAIVYGISIDSPYAQQAWVKQEKIGFTMLSDYQHEVTKAYDVVWPSFNGMGPCSARAVIVIDKQGVVRYAEQTPTLGDMPDLPQIEKVLSGLG